MPEMLKEILIPVGTWAFILMIANSFFQKLCHLEVRIAEQCRNPDHWGEHLCIE